MTRITLTGDGRLWPTFEQHLLIEAACGDASTAGASFDDWCEATNLAAEVPRDYLRLLPLVYLNLLRHRIDRPLMGRLKGVYRRFWFENQRLFRAVRPAVQLLHENGFDLLMTKGAPLTFTYYRDAGARPMGDVDLCVRGGQAERAIELLRAEGWTPHLHQLFNRDYFRFRHAMTLRRPPGGEIDLHWSPLIEGTRTRSQGWGWEGALPFDFEGISVLQPNPGAMLLHGIVHGVRWNRETPIRWIPDSLIVLRERGDSVDWERMRWDARKLGVGRRLGLGLRYLVEHHGAPIPERAVDKIEGLPRTLAERLEEHSPTDAAVHRPPEARRGLLAILRRYAIDLARVADPERPISFLLAFPPYMAHRWRVPPEKILSYVLARLFRRITRRPIAQAGSSPSSSPAASDA